jgi:aminopeptidase N
VGLFTLEQVVGTERFRQAMADYLETYRYRHPTSADFRQSLESSLDTDLDWFFDDFIGGTGVIDYAVGEIENTPMGSTVTITRTGEVRVPVEIRVTLASGAQQMRTWEAREQQTSLTFPPGDPVRQVKIDPEYKLAAEFDRMDNGISTTVEVGPTTTLGGRLLFLFQAVVQTVGLFG